MYRVEILYMIFYLSLLKMYIMYVCVIPRDLRLIYFCSLFFPAFILQQMHVACMIRI